MNIIIDIKDVPLYEISSQNENQLPFMKIQFQSVLFHISICYFTCELSVHVTKPFHKLYKIKIYIIKQHTPFKRKYGEKCRLTLKVRKTGFPKTKNEYDKINYYSLTISYEIIIFKVTIID